MNKHLVPLICLLLSAELSHAQGKNGGGPGGMFTWTSPNGGQPGNTQNYNNSQALVMTRIKSGARVNGSPYADSRWLTAHLTMTNTAQIAPLPLRYDVLNKRLVLQSSDAVSDSMQLNDNALISFVLEEPAANGAPAHERLFRRFMESSEPTQMADYVEVLHDGKFALLKHYQKTYVKATPGNGMADTSDRISDKVTYYVSRPGVAPLPVKLSLKGLQLVLPDFAGALKDAPGAQAAKTDAQWSAVLDTLDKK